MKRISFLLLLCSFCFLKAQETATARGSKAASWEKFRKTFGREKIKLRFPVTPTMTNDGGIIIYSAKDKFGTTYTLVSLPIAEHHDFREDTSQFCLSLLSRFNEHPIQILAFDIYKKDAFGMLDTVIRWKESHEQVRGRAITTKYNAYLLGTTHQEGGTHNHEYFIDSFSLE